jgi:ribokinase
VGRAIGLANRHNVPALLNPAPAQRVPVKLLQQAAWLTPNEGELSALTGLPTRNKTEVESAARKLRMRGVQNVLVTCGARGVCWCSLAGTRWFPAPKVRAIDTVGAGDCFSGTFAAAVAEGKSLEQAIPFAVAAAAISVTRPGAQSSMPTRREILHALSR